MDCEHQTGLSRCVVCEEDEEASERLIAAAPDMLEALKEAKIALSRVGGPQFGRLGKDKHVPELMRAAIAKADGTE